METNKLLSMIGLCKKAGRLLEGNDRVVEATWGGKVKLLLIANDVAENTRRNVQRIAAESKTKILIIPVTKHELGERTGRDVGILGIADSGFAGAIEENSKHFVKKVGGECYR